MDYFLQSAPTAMPLDTERRRSTRKVIRNRAVIGTHERGILQGYTADISVGGLSVLLTTPLVVNTTCSVHFDLSINGKTVRVAGVGKVANCACSGLDGFRVGMKFKAQNEKQQQQLDEFATK